VDCAIACNAKFLVSDDKHFRILKKIPFPNVEVLKAEEFKSIL
jgi:predicted nucleic acid-binding protein